MTALGMAKEKAQITDKHLHEFSTVLMLSLLIELAVISNTSQGQHIKKKRDIDVILGYQAVRNIAPWKQ